VQRPRMICLQSAAISASYAARPPAVSGKRGDLAPIDVMRHTLDSDFFSAAPPPGIEGVCPIMNSGNIAMRRYLPGFSVIRNIISSPDSNTSLTLLLCTSNICCEILTVSKVNRVHMGGGIMYAEALSRVENRISSR